MRELPDLGRLEKNVAPVRPYAREDLLIALSMFELPEAASLLEEAAECQVRWDRVDAAALTALAELKRRGVGSHFETWFAELVEDATPSTRAQLEAAAATGFEVPAGKLRIYTGFEAVEYDDGLQVKAPGFSYFLPR